MQATEFTAIEESALEHRSWTAFQTTICVGGSSVLLWGLIFSLVRWLF